MRMTEYGVNVPDHLLTQLEEEQLVLFLGAGISKIAPSNLPDFIKLTQDICKEAGVTFSRKLSLDYNLSKVSKTGSGYDVHQRVIEKMSPSKTKPNAWHETLLCWFGTESKVRIVTTNFDQHLSSATKQLGWALPEYVAPALPMGDNFHGIVYLHGRIDDKESIVVTGEDFGKAYLNYAWATRFLQAMFAKYTVLFIGHSNRDPLVRYLTSGLSVCTNKHYAFAANNARREWEELDIEPILFQQPGDEKYKAMLHVAKDIAQQYCMSELEHEARIRKLLTTKKDTLLTPQDQDYLLRSLTKTNRQIHFCRYADGQLWLQWAIKHIEEVKSLFDTFAKAENFPREYISWIGDQCFEKANGLLLQELTELKLGSDLWYEIGGAICYRKLNISTERLIAWIYVMLRDATLPGHWALLQEILECDNIPQNRHIGWMIFSRLTKPMIKLNKQVYQKDTAEERPVLVSIAIPSEDPGGLCEYWQTVLRNQLSDICDRVQGIVTLYLTDAYYMLIEQGAWSAELDEVSYGRATIIKEISNDGFTYVRPMDPLIDAAVDLIQWYSVHNQANLNQLIVGWNDSKIPILRRLSLYAVSLANWSEDDKCQWVLSKQLLHWEVYYSESYHLLSSIFANLSSAIKEEAIDALLQIMNDDAGGVNRNCNRRTQTYDLLKSMIGKDIDNPQLLAAIETVRVRYRSTDCIKPPAPIDVSALLSGDIIAAFHWYDEIAQLEDLFSENNEKEKFHVAFREKVSKEIEWAISVTGILWQRDNQNTYYLSSMLLNILSAAQLTHEQQQLLCKKIQGIVELQHIGNAVTSFLRKRADKGFDGYSDQSVDEMFKCVDFILKWAIDVPFSKDPARRWLDAVINHPVSDLIFVLLKILSDHGKDDKYIVAATERLSRLLQEKNITKIAEVICASQVHFLYAIAPDWATTKVIPLFDWSKSTNQAERAWDGFLFWGHFTPNLLGQMLGNFVATANFLELVDQNRYCQSLAWLSMSHFVEKPFATKALGHVILKLNDEQRMKYFSYLCSHLSDIQDQKYSHWVWNSVLLPLLRIRRRMTVELTSGELMAMLRWVAVFTDYCAPLIENMIIFSTVQVKECYNLNYFDKIEIYEKYPQETAKLWIWLAKSLTSGESSNHIYGKIAEKLLGNARVSTKVKQQLQESLIALGLCSKQNDSI